MKKPKLLGIVVVSCFAVVGVLLFAPHRASAATFTVNATTDGGDVGSGDGNCDNGSSACTLRAAIEEANAFVGADTINFSISGSGVHTFTPSSALPNIETPITIDGSTQPGASCGTLVPASLPASNTPHNLKIEISIAGGAWNGITLNTSTASGSTLRGLIINGTTTTSPVFINSNVSNVTVECNYIGTNSSGTTLSSSSGNGIAINGGSGHVVQNNLVAGATNGLGAQGNTITIQNNLIGTNATGTGALPNSGRGAYLTGLYQALISHNVISGNTVDGMYAVGDNFTISGNYFGLGVTGSPLGNGNDGLVIYSSNTFTIGGVTASTRNVISANGGDGIHIYSDCGGSGAVNDSTIFGNYIGTKTDGKTAVGYGNDKAGVEVNEFQGSCGSVYRHQIGGDNSGEQNIIAGNNEQGVLIHQDASHDVFGIAILHNSIFDNGQLGIDLAADSGGDGIVDTDLGPNIINELAITYPSPNSNNYLNRPTINSASYANSKLTVGYDFKANTIENSGDGISLLANDLVGYRLDFYLNDKSTDGAYTGYAQTQKHIGSLIVNGNETNAAHTFDLLTFTSGQTVTATSTLLWTKTPGPALVERPCGGFERFGNGPPYYQESCPL